MFLKKIVLNQKAFTLIEVIISSALLLIIFFAFLTFILNMQRQMIFQDRHLALKNVVQTLFQDISNNTSQYQRHYSCVQEAQKIGCVTPDSLLTWDDLAFAVNPTGQLVPKAKCLTCKSRLGYLLYASGTNSVLKLVIRASNQNKILFNITSFVGE